ncbi:hypothetical protein GUITHDRAFT_110298 [Guillardia theta CCMP2712]|uniref:Uncharacterized protein n=1 Tax=Guillardia theta (strain CCMP2712) TaxID=905079 RepID=L1J5S4_GUITC|nr:hypothetical protein GUITHDRAFT_110298 [Guillardia theta CCMP2712]EKX43846.1 hypothetical protein GUITHDRAFT_110298 [Guillardia theta CCMP2712]|eukprot:XP_005830826.1 hypothetical protein GUITHDRAFT_110298 [Guillardia theta CCMP2712]
MPAKLLQNLPRVISKILKEQSKQSQFLREKFAVASKQTNHNKVSHHAKLTKPWSKRNPEVYDKHHNMDFEYN